MSKKNGNDLVYKKLNELEWSKEKLKDSLSEIYRFVVEEAENSIRWYLEKRKSKRRGARLLRISAIITTTIAGIIPLLSQIIVLEDKPIIAPAWTSVALILSVAFIVLDKFFGFSSSWMRFITTEISIRTKLQEFQLEWEIQKAALGGKPISNSKLIELLGLCKSFLNHINEILTNEAKEWRKEFNMAIKQIEETAQSAKK